MQISNLKSNEIRIQVQILDQSNQLRLRVRAPAQVQMQLGKSNKTKIIAGSIPAASGIGQKQSKFNVGPRFKSWGSTHTNMNFYSFNRNQINKKYQNQWIWEIQMVQIRSANQN